MKDKSSAGYDQWLEGLSEEEKDRALSKLKDSVKKADPYLDGAQRYGKAIKSHKKDSAIALWKVFQGLVDNYAFDDFFINPIVCCRRNYARIQVAFWTLSLRLTYLKINQTYCRCKTLEAFVELSSLVQDVNRQFTGKELKEHKIQAERELEMLEIAKKPRPEEPRSIDDIVSECIER